MVAAEVQQQGVYQVETQAFCQRVVDNIRDQASHLVTLRKTYTDEQEWKKTAQENITKVQTAGNQLESKVGELT